MQNDKNNILEAWIMTERLSEGDFSVKDKANYVFKEGFKGDFYNLFIKTISEKISPKYRKKAGIMLYLDVFDFKEVIDIVRKAYKLEPTNEDIDIGHKFSFSLFFDCNMIFDPKNSFITVSSYIRYKERLPRQKDFTEYESNLFSYIGQQLEDTSSDPEKFNSAICELLNDYDILIENCRYRVIDDISKFTGSLHSFFIDDLEKAKDIDTDNFMAYLYGYNGSKVNLDSKKSSPNFAPQSFEDILQPQNYPLGRFPSNTEYALSLMQQTVVNLSIGLDTRTIRSVNGPPGTGKTTLLKDVFAQHIVDQALSIVSLKDKKINGSDKTKYTDNKSIGVLPAAITEKNIMVASSNNGAVQNIVNELPLSEKIDKIMLDEIKNADYFRDISNSSVTGKWKVDKEGKINFTVNSKEPTEEKNWGLFSLEGGRSDNMNNIRANIKKILEEFCPEKFTLPESDTDKFTPAKFTPDDDAYKDFSEQYKVVENMRSMASKFAEDGYTLGRLTQEYNDLPQRQAELDDIISQNLNIVQRYREEITNINEQKSALEADNKALEEDIASKNEILSLERSRHKGFLGRLGIVGKEQRLREDSITSELISLKESQQEFKKSIQLSDRKIAEIESECSRLLNDNSKKTVELENRKTKMEQEIAACRERLSPIKANPLDMYIDYDQLQLSNPWFSQTYRKAQSKLFIAALRVRKQFLYENIDNIEAAEKIWFSPKKYANEPHLLRCAWEWINFIIPVISSTFASFHSMCKLLGENSMGSLFIDEAGQALPWASVGAIFRCRHVMAVGDPSQIKPVLTLDSNVLRMFCKHFEIDERYLSADASTQTLADAASAFGYYRDPECKPESWIGIPLWVHRRCQYPMFTIANVISYNGMMVQGEKEENAYGKAGWYDVKGTAKDKYVEAQGEFLLKKISEISAEKTIYVITPFTNVAAKLRQKLRSYKNVSVGTIHTFQGKEAPIVFMVLGADEKSKGAAYWAVSEANMMNVAATRAKEEFYIIGDRRLYVGLGTDTIVETNGVLMSYANQKPELVVFESIESDE